MSNNTEKCYDLARAMFPTAVIEPSSTGDGVDIRIYDKPNETRSWYSFDPFTDHTAYHALVCWLDAESVRQEIVGHVSLWHKFAALLLRSVKPDWLMELTTDRLWNAGFIAQLVLTADIAIIAEAAWRAIQEKR